MQIVITIDAAGQAAIASGATPDHSAAAVLSSPGASVPPVGPPAPAPAAGAINAGPAPSGPAGGGPPPFVVADDVAATRATGTADASAGSAPGSIQEPPAITVAGPNGAGTSS